MVRKTVYELFDLWAKWGVFSQLMCQNLRYMFTTAYQEELLMGNSNVQTDENADHYDGEPIDFQPYWKKSNLDNDIDGDPIVISLVPE